MRSCFVATFAATLFLVSAESAAQGLPPAPPAPAPSPTVPNAAPPAPPALPGAPTPPSAPPPYPGPEVTPPTADSLPPAPSAMPPGPGTAPPPPGPGQTTIPQGSPYPQPYPYPYYPPPYYGQGYPPGWGQRPAEPKMKTVWYGWQTLIGVVAGDLVTILGSYSRTEPLFYIGISGHVLTGPIVHWAHGHVGKGFAALGLNVGTPLVAGGLGLLIGGNDLAGAFGALFLGGIGYIVGPTLDMALLSTEQVRDTTTTVPKGARLLLPSSVGFMPMLDQNRRGLMLVGQF